MKAYLTQRIEVTSNGELIVMCGDNIHAINETWARIKCADGYTVIGELIMEIPEEDLVPDWNNAIEY